jgi:hypothetical protein
MKKRNLFLIASLLLSVAGVQTAFAQKVKINLTEGKTLIYKVSRIESIEFLEPEQMGEHEWVDLGLPSGTLWATCNIGAENPEDSGYLIAWGETEPKEIYSWATYQYYENGQLTKYNSSDGLTELQPEDDAATENWGSDWKTPTKEQFDELISNTSNQKASINEQEVRIFTSTVGGYTNQSIILPIRGESGGDYWVSAPLSSVEYPYHLSAWFVSWYTDDARYIGSYIRPVRKP